MVYHLAMPIRKSKHLIRPLFICLLVLASSCKENDLTINSGAPDDLMNYWVESYEEDYGFFRPSDYTNFPVSYYRQSYNFKNRNMCEYLVLSPVDAHYMENGFWEYDSKQQIIRIYTSDKKLLEELKVISLSSELLQIEM
jgi:hypothetical protein